MGTLSNRVWFRNPKRSRFPARADHRLRSNAIELKQANVSWNIAASIGVRLERTTSVRPILSIGRHRCLMTCGRLILNTPNTRRRGESGSPYPDILALTRQHLIGGLGESFRVMGDVILF
jgi:hypothetical protein